MKVFKVTTWLVFCPLFVFSQADLDRFVQQFHKQEIFEHAHLGVAVHDVESGKLLYGYQHKYMQVPASSLKLITTLSGLEVLGPHHTFKTYIGYDGRMDPDGTITGNVYIIGQGDPTLGSSRPDIGSSWESVVQKIGDIIKKAGITCIDGSIVADESFFDSFPVAPTWQWNDLGNYYAGGAWAININENEYSIYFDSNKKVGQSPSILYYQPAITGLQLVNEVTTAGPSTGDNAYIFGGPYDYKKRIVGTIPQSAKPFRIKGAIPDPPLFLAEKVARYLAQNKIPNGGIDVIFSKNQKRIHPMILDSLESPELKEVARLTNVHSINLYAESILKTMGHRKGGEGSGSHGIAAIESLFKSKGLDTDQLVMMDGSGLSARNMVTPDLMSNCLSKYARQYGVDQTCAVLPQAGKEGTVSGFLSASPAKGRVWVKSGSMEKVITFTGIIHNKSGKYAAFSIMANGYQGSYTFARKQIEKIVHQIFTNY